MNGWIDEWMNELVIYDSIIKQSNMHYKKRISYRKRRNPLPPLYGLLFSSSSKGSFTSLIVQGTLYNNIYCTSCGTLDGTSNSSMGTRSDHPQTESGRTTTKLHVRKLQYSRIKMFNNNLTKFEIIISLYFVKKNKKKIIIQV